MAATTEAMDAIDGLVLELEASEDRQRARKKADRERLRAGMEMMVCALFAASGDEHDGWRSYGRAEKDYVSKSRYNRPHTARTAVVAVADWLLAAGYAVGQLGHFKRHEFGGKGGSGFLSRIGPTPKLLDLLDHHGLNRTHIGFAPWTETVILRAMKTDDRRGADMEYTDTTETTTIRANLRTLNEALGRYRISRRNPEGAYVDIAPFQLRRIFNNGSFSLGGRFYSNRWEGMPKSERDELLIDGEEVVELDFHAFHARLIYQLEGQPLPTDDDPYDVQGWRTEGARGWVKTGFNQLINSGPDMNLRRPKEIPEMTEKEWQELLNAFAAKHDQVKHWFRSGRGLELQRLDSDIAELVMLDMLGRGVCCLPVHDSFIVPASHKDKLHQSMSQAYASVLNEIVDGVAPAVIA